MHSSLAKNSSIIGLSCEPRSSQWNQRSKRTSVLSATKYLRPANMMIAVANYHVQHHNFKINLSPSVSSCRRSLSTTRPTVSAPRFGEWGILEKILSAGYPLLRVAQLAAAWQPGCRKMEKEYENEEEMEREWGNGERFPLYISSLSFFPPSVSIPYIKICPILSQYVKYVTFVASVIKRLT